MHSAKGEWMKPSFVSSRMWMKRKFVSRRLRRMRMKRKICFPQIAQIFAERGRSEDLFPADCADFR